MKWVLQSECAPSRVALEHGSCLLHECVQVDPSLLCQPFSRRFKLVLVARQHLHGLLRLRIVLDVLLKELHRTHAALTRL